MLKEYLEKAYGYNEPIFISEIQLEGISDNALRQYFKRMVQSGDIIRFDTGVYYLPKASRILKKSYLDPMKVIIRKYIKNAGETYGYFSGATFANQIGLTTQMPTVLEIVTSRESTKGRIVTVDCQKVRLNVHLSKLLLRMQDCYSFWILFLRLTYIRNIQNRKREKY